MDFHVFKSLRSHLLLRVLKNEISYLTSALIMFTALFFILFALFTNKEIFIHYSDSNSMLLPKSIIVVDDTLENVNKTLQKNNISKKNLLLAESKNYKDLSIYININGEKSLPKNFTLLSFEINKKAKLTFECHGERAEVNILDIVLKHQKDWIFKTQKLSHCKRKEEIYLIVQDSKIKMKLKKNKTYAKLEYTADINSDKLLYPYLINLEESLFLNYFAYSKFFIAKSTTLSKETQEHAKMLNSLFKIIFAKARKRVLLNHESYSFLTEYKKIPFTIKALHSDFHSATTVLDELALNITNEKTLFYKQLLIANSALLKGVTYDKVLIFSKDDTIDEQIFTNAIKIDRSDFDTVKQSSSKKINLTIYITLFILFILMLALINSFITRNYKLYKETFSILIFHGFNFKIVTFILSVILFISFTAAYIITLLLLNEVNNIFDLYYVDLIRLNFEYNYIIMFFALSIISSYLYELKAQTKIINKAKGR